MSIRFDNEIFLDVAEYKSKQNDISILMDTDEQQESVTENDEDVVQERRVEARRSARKTNKSGMHIVMFYATLSVSPKLSDVTTVPVFATPKRKRRRNEDLTPTPASSSFNSMAASIPISEQISPIRGPSMVDRSLTAQADTRNALLSPFPQIVWGVEKTTQTNKMNYYEEEYVDFLKTSHALEVKNRDYRIRKLEAENKRLQDELDESRLELLKEKERVGNEKGWKKYF